MYRKKKVPSFFVCFVYSNKRNGDEAFFWFFFQERGQRKFKKEGALFLFFLSFFKAVKRKKQKLLELFIALFRLLEKT